MPTTGSQPTVKPQMGWRAEGFARNERRQMGTQALEGMAELEESSIWRVREAERLLLKLFSLYYPPFLLAVVLQVSTFSPLKT